MAALLDMCVGSTASWGAKAIAGLIYTQAKNHWRFMPIWLRVASWIVTGVGAAITLVNLVTQGT